MLYENILIIEDDPFQQQLLLKLLSQLSLGQVNVASNGLFALAMIEDSLQPDLIICDLNMPEMDGVQFLSCLSKRDINCRIVLISAAANDVVSSVQSMAKAYGFKQIDIINKPVSRLALKNIVNHKQSDNNSYEQQSISFTIAEVVSAFHQGQISAFYQPHFDTDTQKICGAEALARWQHPQYGELAPAKFLSTLLNAGMGYALTLHMLEQAISDTKKWQEHFEGFQVSVNVTPSDLSHFSFIDSLLSLLKEYNLKHECLTLELTETEICRDFGKLLEATSRLRLQGIGISIDDFGTGHSSLTQLIEAPFSELKIDRGFVHQMLDSKKHLAAVTMSISLAKSLSLRVVAEGVESPRQQDILTNIGCDVLQGFLFTRALSRIEFSQWLNHFYQNKLEQCS